MRRIRRSVQKRILICFSSIFVGVICLYSVYFFTRKTTVWTYEEKLHLMEEQLLETERIAYVAVREISAGETFTEENVRLCMSLSKSICPTVLSLPVLRAACLSGVLSLRA